MAPGWEVEFGGRVAPLLREAGHVVDTPTLTGLGEWSHLANPSVGLETHVTDIVQSLEHEDSHDVVLVGHSRGGIVVTGAAARVSDRLKKLVSLDAFVPRNGQSLHDLVPPRGAEHNRVLARTERKGWYMPLEDRFRAGPHDEVTWMSPRRGRQLRRAFPAGGCLGDGSVEHLPRTYIHCTDKPAGDVFSRFSAKAGTESGWTLHELHSDHTPQVSHPRELSQLLTEFAHA